MFINHMHKDGILYLEIDINYDFGNFKKNNNKFIDELKKYIDKTKLNIKKNKIIITCSGIIIGSILITDIDRSNDFSDAKYVPSFKDSITYVINDDKEEKNEIVINDEVKDNEVVINNAQNNVKNTNSSNNNSISNSQNSNNNAIYHNKSDNNTTNIVETQPSVTNITVYRSNGSIINVNLEDYVIGVIAAEMPASFNKEAIKAQSVIARTYALKAKTTGKRLTDTVSTQSYIDTGEMQNKWGASYNTYYNKIKSAVSETIGEYLEYNGTYIEAMYHSTNNGRTESSLDVFGNYYPYLISVTSDYDKSASSYLREINIDFNTISNKLGINFNNSTIIEILEYTDGGNIKTINIGDKTYTGRQVRELLGLRSADFDIKINDGSAAFITRGYGHGVGMSQYGANGMANAGYNYKDILSHYYPGTNLKR